jgi:hypothetical protein
MGLSLGKLFGGSESKTKTVSSLSAEQQSLSKMLGPYLQSLMKQGASPYGGQLVADIPDLFTSAYNLLGSRAGLYNKDIYGALRADASGLPAWQWDEGRTAKQFENFAIPTMNTWRQTVMPLVREQYNSVPGGLYSRDRASGIVNTANEYYGRYVQPKMYDAYQSDINRAFQSTEAAAARRAPAAQLLSQLPFQQFGGYASAADIMRQYRQAPLTAQYQEFLRTSPEQSPWLQYAINYLGVPMTNTVALQGQQGLLSQILGMGGGLATGAGISKYFGFNKSGE